VAKRNPHTGSRFDDFLKEEGIHEEVEALAVKRVIVYQLEQELSQKHISKKKFAELMHTSRSEVDRLIDPNNDSLTLATLNKAANVLGKKLEIKFKHRCRINSRKCS